MEKILLFGALDSPMLHKLSWCHHLCDCDLSSDNLSVNWQLIYKKQSQNFPKQWVKTVKMIVMIVSSVPSRK